jgi:hypothetical protein
VTRMPPAGDHTMPLRHGYTMADLDRLTRKAALGSRWRFIDFDERADAGHARRLPEGRRRDGSVVSHAGVAPVQTPARCSCGGGTSRSSRHGHGPTTCASATQPRRELSRVYEVNRAREAREGLTVPLLVAGAWCGSESLCTNQWSSGLRRGCGEVGTFGRFGGCSGGLGIGGLWCCARACVGLQGCGTRRRCGRSAWRPDSRLHSSRW